MQFDAGSWINWGLLDDRLIPGGGEHTSKRIGIQTGALPLTTTRLRMRFWTALRTERITRIGSVTGGQAAAATPTLCRKGVYTVDSNTGDLTLIAATANDTSLWSAANTAYTPTLTTPFMKYEAKRYCCVALCVTAATAPNILGSLPVNATGGSAAPMLQRLQLPVVNASMSGVSDLAAIILNSALGDPPTLDYTPHLYLLP